MLPSDALQVANPDLVYDTIEGEVIILDIQTGIYYQPNFGSALFRRQAIERLGLAHQRLGGALDLDWHLPARERNIPVLTHQDVVQYYRRHDRNTANDPVRAKQSLLIMLKDSLARRKEPGLEGMNLPPDPSRDTLAVSERNE